MVDQLCNVKWIGFDLDDTLHDFTKASFKASYQIFIEIHNQYETSIVALQKEYYLILHRKTATAFSDGRTSFDYRRERFQALLERFELPIEERFLDRLGNVYEAALMNSLELKTGVRELFAKLKKMDKRILIITEGPQGAQERAIDALGIRPWVDVVATSDQYGTSKVNGLFGKVLLQLGVSKHDFTYLGDNRARDIKPCEAEGISAIWVTSSHNGTGSLCWSTSPVVSSIWMLLSELHRQQLPKELERRKAQAWEDEKAKGWDPSRSNLGGAGPYGAATSWAEEWAIENRAREEI